jgi:hypothetical protein
MQKAKAERVGVSLTLYTPIQVGNIKIKIKCIGFECVDSIHVILDRVQWQNLENAAINIRFPQKAGNVFIS